ncbi:MAG: creatininase family protein, partial [Pseudomonadota bacterium]
VAREMRVRHGLLAVSANWWECGFPEGLLSAEEAQHGLHGGRSETAVMLHLRPHLVRMDRAQDFRSAGIEVAARHSKLRLSGAPAISWMAEDLHPAGVVGNAKAATAADGQLIVETAARGLATLLDEVSAYPLTFGSPP